MYRALVAIALTLLPASVARAAVTVDVAPFGHHTTTPVDLVTSPIGAAECGDLVTLSLTGLTARDEGARVDVWFASDPLVDCASAVSRYEDACTHLSLEEGALTRDTSTIEIRVAASTLFGDLTDACSGTVATRTFFFLDTATPGDVTTTFAVDQRARLPIALDTLAPSAPVVDGDAAGDTALTVSWVSPADLAAPSGTRFYFDPSGCAYDTVPGSFTLFPGHAPPESALVWSTPEDGTSADDATTLETTAFGWATTRYADTGVLAMTVVDEAGNESPLSNLICVYHARCLGDGGTTPDCAPSGLFCSVAAPGGGGAGRGVLAALIAAACLWLGRRACRPIGRFSRTCALD